MSKIDKLDFDVSLNASFNKTESRVVDFYEKKDTDENRDKEDDLVSFSSILIECFKNKIKASEKRVRVDSVVDVYKNAEGTYNPKQNITLSEWCMACVNNYLSISQGTSFNLIPTEAHIEQAKEDLKEYKLEENFASVDELYLETRKESIQHAVSAHCRYF